MKIDFGSTQPTINSLYARVSDANNSSQYQGYIVGSQPMLRSRLKRYPLEADKINPLLEKKDIDIRFEPITDTAVDMPALRAITEKYNQSLSKKKKKELPLHWLSYYSLPANEVKHGKKNKLDPSVQRCKIKPCMNIDIKADFTGEIHYANDKHRHDFEVKYLEENTIIFYDLDSYNMSNLDSMTKLAFMLKKCINPEVKDFGSRLDYESADFVRKLFESKNNRDKIMSIIRDHYDLDTVQVEEDIVELYTRSIQIEIDIVNSAITETKIIIDSMLFTIAQVKGKNDELQSELDNIMAINSSASLDRLQEQLKSLAEFKRKILSLYHGAEKSLEKYSSPVEVKAQTGTQDNKTKGGEKKAPLNTEKKKKKTAPAVVSNGISNREIDEALKEAKALAAMAPRKPLTPEQEFQALIRKHQPCITALPSIDMAYKTSNPDAIYLLRDYSLLTYVLTESLSNEAVRLAFFAVNDFYLNMIQRYKSEILSASTETELTEAQFNDIRQKLLLFNPPHDNKNIRMMRMMRMNEVIREAHIWNGATFKESWLGMAINRVRNYIDSQNKNRTQLVTSIFDIVASSQLPVENCVKLISEASHLELKVRVTNPKRNVKTITAIRELIALFAQCAMIRCYHEVGETIDLDFVQDLIQVSFENDKSKMGTSNRFIEEFVISTINVLKIRDHFKLKCEINHNFITATFETIKAIFPTAVFADNDDVVVFAKRVYLPLLSEVSQEYTILGICSHIISIIQSRFPSIDSCDEGPCMIESAFKGSQSPTFEQDLKLAIDKLQLIVKKVAKRLDTITDINRVIHFKMIVICLQELYVNFELMHKPDFQKKFTEALLKNEYFATLLKTVPSVTPNRSVSQVVSHAYAPTSTPRILQRASLICTQDPGATISQTNIHV